MKKRLALVCVFLLLFVSLANGLEEISPFCIIKVSPKEFYPCEVHTINITLKNTGLNPVYHVTTEFAVDPNSPIKIVGETKKIVNSPLGYVDENEEFVVHYKLYVDKDARAGVYYLPLNIFWTDSLNEQDFKDATLLIGIRVKMPSEEAKIELINVTANPSELIPGTSGILIVKLRNVGKTIAKSVTVRVLPGGPIIPIGSDFEKRIVDVKPNETVELYFKIGLNWNISPNITFYKLPLIINYEDEFGSYTENYSVGIPVRGKPKVMIQDIVPEPSKLTPDTEGTLLITLINTGTETAEDVKVKIAGGDKILTESYKFVGELPPGHTQTIIFGVYVDKDAEIGQYGLSIIVSYKDKFGNDYSNFDIYELSVYPSEPFIPIEYVFAFIAIVIVFVIVYLIIKMEIAKRRKEGSRNGSV